MLSREEEVELACSKKKVKDIHHAKFSGAVREDFPPIDNFALTLKLELPSKTNLEGKYSVHMLKILT